MFSLPKRQVVLTVKNNQIKECEIFVDDVDGAEYEFKIQVNKVSDVSIEFTDEDWRDIINRGRYDGLCSIVIIQEGQDEDMERKRYVFSLLSKCQKQ